jgi:hypothetical protein
MTLMTNSTGSTVTVTFQQNLPLADSLGNNTGVMLNVLATVPNNKSDGIHNSGLPLALGTGSDGLTANPVQVMGQSWSSNGSSETLIFQLTGLTPNFTFNLYMYGGGPNGGNGASFSLPASNRGEGYGSGTGWYSTAGFGNNGAYLTVPGGSSTYHSVFSTSGGNNPAPEQGLAWVLLPSVADANGNLSVYVQEDNPTTSKGYVNGFQLEPVPEPATLSLLGAAALGLLSRRRRDD